MQQYERRQMETLVILLIPDAPQSDVGQKFYRKMIMPVMNLMLPRIMQPTRMCLTDQVSQ
jgi:hypothetical protein